MNILYISNLSGHLYAGPTHSVPRQIFYQSKLDSVMWYNLVENKIDDWKKLSYYFDLNDYPDKKISKLPEPFNNPDLVIIESFYHIVMNSRFIFELIHRKIPYIIIPRGELTEKAQKRKMLKKMIANIIICKKYAKKALAIQYLTNKEKLESEKLKWSSKSIIIPNGIESLEVKKEVFFCSNKIKCIFIGRIEPYQKGLDILIKACVKLKEKLNTLNCEILIYGPDVDGKLNDLKAIVKNLELENTIKFYGEIYGKDKVKVLLESDVFLMPSRFEGHPMALIEALSYGLPAVVSTGSNMREEIEQNDAGWGADANVNDFAFVLNKMLDELNLCEKKGKNARKLAINYTWGNISKISHIKYDNLLKNTDKDTQYVYF
ncbi:glycosyltransferase [Fusobacterium sp.]|uniref:glycosyltransferase n=1 Tax=Fusobacterium sp. TaxID=68766 RepID=UPI00135669D0|nr:glycosyltransferase [Fusobacterium sp.]